MPPCSPCLIPQSPERLGCFLCYRATLKQRKPHATGRNACLPRVRRVVIAPIIMRTAFIDRPITLVGRLETVSKSVAALGRKRCQSVLDSVFGGGGGA